MYYTCIYMYIFILFTLLLQALKIIYVNYIIYLYIHINIFI